MTYRLKDFSKFSSFRLCHTPLYMSVFWEQVADIHMLV